MRLKSILLISLLSILSTTTALAQEDLYSRIKPLEGAVNNGMATRDQQLELARLYIGAGRFYEASKIANRLIAIDANDAEAARLREEATRGLREVSDRRVSEAEAKARMDGATDADRLALADAYFEAGSYRSAAEGYARLPESILDREARLRHARALAWSGQMDAAERHYSRALKEQRTPELELEYGRLLSWMGASRASVQQLRDVYKATPTEESAIALANAEAWNGNRDGAIRLLGEYTAANPNSAEAGRLLDQLRGSPEVRLERIDKLIDLEPFNLSLRVERARLLIDAGRYGEATKEVRFVRERSNEIEGLAELERRAATLRAEERSRTAERLKTLTMRDERSADQLLELAKAYTALEDYGRAIDLYEEYLELRPDDTNARIAYARVLSWDRRYSASKRQYEKLIDQNPDRADLRLEYAQILSYDSDFANAMSMFSSLTDLSANPRAHLYTDVPARAHYNRGQIYRWFGWNEHAVMEQNRALALDNGYVPARQELDLVRHLRPTSNAELRYTAARDSNDFSTRRADVRGEKWVSQRTGYTASLGRHEFSQANQDVAAWALSGGVNYRWEDRWLGRARVGATLYDEGLGTRPFWGLGATWLPNLQSRAAFDYNRYDLVYDVFTLASLGSGAVALPSFGDPISIDDFRAHYDWNGGGLLSFLGDASYGFISDDNRRLGAHGVVAFRILRAPFVAIKADGRYLSYDFRTNRYWSPADYQSLAGVLQVGQNVRDRFFWSAEIKYGRSWEGERESDLRSYSANVAVPVGDTFDLIGNWGYGRSGRLDDIFGGSGDFVNYWQRHWYVGLRVKQLFSRDDRRGEDPWYYDNRPLTGSPVIPLGEVH